MFFDPRPAGSDVAEAGSTGNRHALPLPDIDLPMIF